MSRNRYDAIVVGARAAGASTAMLLARRGMKVLVVDRAQYGSDTLSTHALMRPAVMQLSRWGLLDAVIASGTPAIRRAVFHYPEERVAVDVPPVDGIDALYAPRRTVLDRILADAARAAGAELRFGVIVDDLATGDRGRVTGVSGRDDGGGTFACSADVVIGADGIRSVVALAAGAETVKRASVEGAVVYGYFSGIETEGYEWAYGEGVSAGLIPTNGGETCVFVGGSTARFRRAVHGDLDGGMRKILGEVSPGIAARVAAGTPSGRLRGFSGVRGYYRRAFGPGWALVGDAGFFRDPITTHGITDALRDAELLARAIAGPSSLAEYERLRDSVSAELFEVTERIAGYDWSIDELKTHLRAMSRAMKAETALIASFDAEAAVA